MVHLKLNQITGILLASILVILIFGLIIFPMMIQTGMIDERGMIDEESENGAGTDGIAMCIDGIYFGVCTGDQHFDSGQACFGLTTQQCFDKCNSFGRMQECRIV